MRPETSDRRKRIPGDHAVEGKAYSMGEGVVGIKDRGELVLQQNSGYFMLTGHKKSPRTEE